MSNIQEVITLLQKALTLLDSSMAASPKKEKSESTRGGNKGLIKLDLQRKMVLKEMLAVWEKLPAAKREEKRDETTTKAGKETTKQVFTHPQPTYKDAISECKARKDKGQELPEVPADEIEAAWAKQQEKKVADDEEVEKPVVKPVEKPAEKVVKKAEKAEKVEKAEDKAPKKVVKKA